jgi:hypothetical protein
MHAPIHDDAEVQRAAAPAAVVRIARPLVRRATLS